MLDSFHHSPATSSFLTSFIDDEIHNVLTSLWISLLENICRNFNEERF